MSAIADERRPAWVDGVPVCTEEKCPCFDGKRCRAMGFRPDRMCEPEVAACIGELSILREAINDIADGDDDWEEVQIARAAKDRAAHQKR